MHIPADVPKSKEKTYQQNLNLITKKTGRLMLFAGDQRVEHLHNDFYGEGIAKEDQDPEHLFRIAKKANIGCFAAQMGLVARYGKDYSSVPYLIKLNSKTNLVKTDQLDPYSYAWYDVDDVVEFAKISGLKIPAVGYTLYLGSEYEQGMLCEAAQIIRKAHKNGMVAVIWIYPRGKAILDEQDPHLIAGAADVGACLGADFIKVSYPKPIAGDRAESFKEACNAAGRAGIITAGGSSMDVEDFLQTLHDQIFISGCRGNATGRNIHQKPLDEAVAFCNAISAITFEKKSVKEALTIYKKK